MTDTDDPLADIRQRCASDINIDKGWHNLIIEMDAALVEIDPDIRYLTLRAVEGHLAIETTTTDPKAEWFISRATKVAWSTCEQCERWAGTARKRGEDNRALCFDCAQQLGYKP